VKEIEFWQGSKSPDIAVWQTRLMLKADGIFGAKTRIATIEACKRFNRGTPGRDQFEKVREDGIVDGPVWHSQGLTDFARRVPIPEHSNAPGIRLARQSTMVNALGDPSGIEPNQKLQERMLYNVDILGKFRISGYNPACQCVFLAMSRILDSKPDLFRSISSAGMLNVRKVRGSSFHWSNHAWGTAIDLKIDGQLDTMGDGYAQVGLIECVPFFNSVGFFAGIDFSREDAMHFEASENLVRKWTGYRS
jgi:hypothetical protein